MCMIKISIIIPNYNSALLIERCLNSVFNQTGDYNLEVIVVDDESTDHSLEVLGDYPQSLIVLRQANQGQQPPETRVLQQLLESI